MRHRLATLEDSEILGALNYQLIQDEGHRHALGVSELAERMRGWLVSDYQASVFEDGSGILAYALYRESTDHLYLRQFFVQRRKRRSGIGRHCMKVLLGEVWPRNKRITVEVLCHNGAAIAFWRSIGFTDYSLALEIDPGSKPNFAG